MFLPLPKGGPEGNVETRENLLQRGKPSKEQASLHGACATGAEHQTSPTVSISGKHSIAHRRQLLWKEQ